MGMPPQQTPPQERMNMAPSQIGGFSPQGLGMNDFAVIISARNAMPGGRQWPDTAASPTEENREATMMTNLLFQQDHSSSSDSDELFLLQQEHKHPTNLLHEQERLTNLLRQQRNMAESSSPPPAKRQRLPTNSMSLNANHGMDLWKAQSKDPIAELLGFPVAGAVLQKQSTKPVEERKPHAKSFPVILMDAIEKHHDEHVVTWLPDGKSFVVVDQERFAENVLLLDAFRGGKYTSFVRKLNRWGFRRLTCGAGVDCFHNPLFLRDRPELCSLISSGAGQNLGEYATLPGSHPAQSCWV